MSGDCNMALPCGAMGVSAVCDCGISWSYSLFRSESDWIVGTEQPSFSGSLVLSMSAEANPT